MGFALLFIVDVMLHISGCGLDPVSRQIGYCTDEQVRCWTVVTFVIVLNNPLPVCIQVHFPVMIKVIIRRIIGLASVVAHQPYGTRPAILYPVRRLED